MTLFSIGIVAHYSRQNRAARLAEAVGAEVVVIDQGGLGAGSNHEVCYEWLAETNAPWSVILEDDALPCKGFRDQLQQVLLSSPTNILSLYLGRTRPPHWQPSIAKVIGGDHHYLIGTELLHHVAVAIRTPMISAMLHHIRTDNPYRLGQMPIDEAVGRYARASGTHIGYSHPSIVNHDANLPTVITRHLSQHKGETGKRTDRLPRQAWAFGVRKSWDRKIAAAIPEPV